MIIIVIIIIIIIIMTFSERELLLEVLTLNFFISFIDRFHYISFLTLILNLLWFVLSVTKIIYYLQ